VHRVRCAAQRLQGALATRALSRLRSALRSSYGKNRDLAVPFWSTKDPGQKPFSFNIGQGAVIKARQPRSLRAAGADTAPRRRGTRAWRRCRSARSRASPPPPTTRESAARAACNRRARADSARAFARSYGAGGFPAWGIMPNSTLIFEIEVLSAQ